MIYKVRARFREDRLAGFYTKLTDGSIISQKPDGKEIVDSMKKAKITAPGVMEWYEKCFCPVPLQHERKTVYNHYLDDMITEKADHYGEIEGQSFWDYISRCE